MTQVTALLFGGVPVILLVRKLVQVHDAFQLRQEMLSMMGTCLFCVGENQNFHCLLLFQNVRGARGNFWEEHFVLE